MLFFSLGSGWLAVILFALIFGATGFGLWFGRRLRHRQDTLREPLSVLQGSLLGVVGLVLAFGLSLAIGRYEARRASVVAEANTIGTTFLRAQTLAEPMRSSSLQLLDRYAETQILLTQSVPGSAPAVAAVATGSALQRQLWTLAGQALVADPNGSAPRLYVEGLNEMIDEQTVHVAAFSNRIPSTVLILETAGAAAALALQAVYLAFVGRGMVPIMLAAAMVGMLLYVTFDLDRPTRGIIQVSPAPLIAQRASMDLPPAATGPK